MLRFTARSASSGPRHLRAIRLSESAATSAGSQTLLPTAIVASVSSAQHSACWAPARTFRGARRGVHPSVPRRNFASWRPPPHDAAQLVRWLKEADAPLWDDAKERGTYPPDLLADHRLGDVVDRDLALERAKAFVTSDPLPRTGRGGKYKAPYSIMATWGSPGTGKSHMLDEIVARADGWVRETGYADRCLPLVANFNGDTNAKLEKHGLAIRLLLGYFCPASKLTPATFRRSGNALAECLPTKVYVGDIVDAIVADFAANHDVPVERVKVVLAVDEIAKSGDKKGTYREIVSAVDGLWPRVGAVITSLEQTAVVTEFGASESAGSNRPIKWLPLLLLNTYKWCEKMNITDRYHQKLVAMSGGHARTMQHVLNEIEDKTVLAKSAEHDTKQVTDALLEHYGELAKNIMTYSSDSLEKFLFEALIGQLCPLDDGAKTRTPFGKAVRAGQLLNADFDAPVGASQIPLVSLFGWFVYAHDSKNIRQQYLLSELFKERDGLVFERLFALHLSVLFELLASKAPRVQLFHNNATADEAGKALFRGAKFIHTPNLAVEELRLKCKTGRIMAVEEDLWRMPASGLTVSTTETLVPSPYETITKLRPFDIIYSRAENQAGFDLFVLVNDADYRPHLLLLELKQSKKAETKIPTSALAEKITLVADRLDELLEKPLVRDAGITSASQVTLCFATLSDLAGDVDQKLHATAQGMPFNVVVLDRPALKTHFGPSLAPAIAIYDHMRSS